MVECDDKLMKYFMYTGRRWIPILMLVILLTWFWYAQSTFDFSNKIDPCWFHSLPIPELIKPKWIEPLAAGVKQLVLQFSDTVVQEPSRFHHHQLSAHPLAVIFVMSLPDAKSRRNEIRDTWYRWKDQIRIEVYFFVGISGRNSSKILEEEINLYQDIIFDNHPESYYTLTVKVLRAMKYFLRKFPPPSDTSTSLSPTPFFIKTDDDVFINLVNLGHHLDHVVQRKRRHYVGGNLYTLARPNRDPSSKFYIPITIYKGCYWPDYVAGSLYIMTLDAVRLVFEESFKTQQFLLPFEDVYLTGILANRQCGIDIFNIKGIYDMTSTANVVLNNTQTLIEAISITPVQSMINIFKVLQPLLLNVS